MAWTLTKEGANVLKLDDGVNDPHYLNWDDITLDINGDFVKISQKGVIHDGQDQFVINYADFTTPSGASAEIVMDAITALFNGGSGDASASNQTTMINELKLGSTSDVSSVVSSATSVTLKAANSNRKSLHIVNDSTKILRIKYGSTASATSYTHKLGVGDEIIITDYNGVVDGIWESANGNARITEITL